MVEYTYDAWGKVESVMGSMANTIGALNPIRYRGYYYDTDLNMYYLQSRYYDPEMGRFISSDDAAMSMNALEDITAANLFVYCGNDPVNRVDPSGYMAITGSLAFLGLCVGVVAIVAVTSVYMLTPQFQQSWNNLCQSISRGLGGLWNRITAWFQSATTVVTKAVEKNTAKAKDIIKTKRNQDYYWIDSKVIYSRKGKSVTTYFPCMSILKSVAITYVRSGGDVFASSKSAARKLAAAINGGTPVGPEISGKGPGYFWHYHARKRVGAGSGGGHIFYI